VPPYGPIKSGKGIFFKILSFYNLDIYITDTFYYVKDAQCCTHIWPEDYACNKLWCRHSCNLTNGRTRLEVLNTDLANKRHTSEHNSPAGQTAPLGRVFRQVVAAGRGRCLKTRQSYHWRRPPCRRLRQHYRCPVTTHHLTWLEVASCRTGQHRTRETSDPRGQHCEISGSDAVALFHAYAAAAADLTNTNAHNRFKNRFQIYPGIVACTSVLCVILYKCLRNTLILHPTLSRANSETDDVFLP